MSPLEASLLRIADRLGLDRLATDPTLARVALKDLFPDEPLVVSLLTAAVEHGALAALQDDDHHVPLTVLGPRLAQELRRNSGISDAGARWAVAAWAAAAGRLPRTLPGLPDDGSDPQDALVFTPPRPAGPMTADAGENVAPAALAATDDVETIIRSAPSEVDEPSSRDSPTAVPDGRDEELDPDSTHLRSDLAEDPDDAIAGDARTLVAPTVNVPAVVESVPSQTTIAAAEPHAADPVEVDSAPSDAVVGRTASSTAVNSADGDPARESARAKDSGTIPSSAAPELEDEHRDENKQPAEAEAEPPAQDTEPTHDDRPPVLAPARRLRPRRRRIALVAASAALLLLAAAGVVAFAVHPSTALTIGTRSGDATWTVDGRPTTLSDGATLTAGAVVQVRTRRLELHAGGSVLRFASGAKARVENATTVALLAGRAFVLVDGPRLTVHSSAGDATVSRGRALVGCAASTCTVTALDRGTSLTSGSHTTALAALQRSGSDTRSYVLADAIRADSWFTTNDALDRAQSRTPVGLGGRKVIGTWLLTVSRSDLPFTLSRTMALATDCSSQGCSVTAAIRMSDGVPQSRSAGAARSTTPDGSHITVDYGSHSARCHWVVGTKKGQGVDGSETVTDTLRFQGSGAAETMAGERTTRYTATGAACSTAEYTAAKTARLSGSLATPDQLTGSAQAARWNQQQAKLNYVADEGLGCATSTAAPKTGLQAGLRCGYRSNGSDPTSVDLAVYGRSAELVAAYRSAATGLVPADTGDCTVGPCEGVAPNQHGRTLLMTDAKGALLITYDPRAANLLLTVRGPSMQGLARWWSTQQRTRSMYQASPIPRTGV